MGSRETIGTRATVWSMVSTGEKAVAEELELQGGEEMTACSSGLPAEGLLIVHGILISMCSRVSLTCFSLA